MKKILLLFVASILLFGCNKKDEMDLIKIIDYVREQVAPINEEAGTAYWNGTITGNPEEFEKYTNNNIKINSILSNKETFEKLKKLKEHGRINNPLLKRQLDVLYNSFLGNQVDTVLLNKISKKETALEQKYAEYRAVYKGNPINDNKVEEILRTSVNNKDLEEVWLAHKGIGKLVAADIIEIVKLRNEVAKSLGYNNFHTMSLMLSEQDPDEISALFDELDLMTRDGFTKLKAEIDMNFAKRYGVKAEELMPWHYQGRYFQEAPNLYPIDLDKYYTGKNLEKLTIDFYKGIGLDISSIMQNSDLYPKNNKNQHAFCIDINRNGDVRVLCNVTDNEQWMGTMLHEFGHGIYSLGHDSAGNPYFLRDAAHTFTTEGVAMLFGRLSRNPQWMKQMLGLTDIEYNAIAENCIKSTRLQQLVFSRWVQVVYRFEKEMYANPDQDLNNLWWDLVEKYQMLKRPANRNEPDWASKIHIALYPCYYHNYQLGELFASQMHYYIVNNISKSKDYKNECYIGNNAIGLWMQEYIFNPGMRYPWNEMIKNATGEKLTAKYYKMQFVD
ncbi:MAG: M2 family metallopeptidase [Bacteroidales bacterium]|jgi:peptidyl-dipeptidase A